jgi:hypothetical protein
MAFRDHHAGTGYPMLKTIVIAALALMLAVPTLGAQRLDRRPVDTEFKASDEDPAQKAPAPARPAFKRLLLGVHGGFGVTFPSGDIAGDGDQKGLAYYGYTAGIDTCWRCCALGGPSVRIEYASRPISFERSYIDSTMTSVIDTASLDFMAGFRFLLSIFYIEPGMYYALGVGTWTETIEYRGKTSTTKVKDSWKNNEAGCYLEAGVMFSVTSFMSVDIGLRMEVSFLYAYDHDDRLRTNLGMLTAGVTFKML